MHVSIAWCRVLFPYDVKKLRPMGVRCACVALTCDTRHIDRDVS